MKTIAYFYAAAAVLILGNLTGCISVKREEVPDTTTTTTTRFPASSTTVERTTVY